MSTVTTWQTTSEDSETTERIAEKIGQNLRGGEVIELASDLGGGKTTFVRGLARGAGSKDRVASPTFTISKVYETDKFQMYHFDFYRLAEAGIVADELAEVIGDPKMVTVVEWGGVVQNVLPENRLTLTISQTPEGYRSLAFTVPASLGYLLDGVQ